MKDLASWAAKLTCAVFCADFLTMLLMNVFRLYTHWLPIVFFALLIVAAVWIFHGRLIAGNVSLYFSSKELRWLTFLALALGMLFACVRIPYLLEGHLHHLVGPVVYDDTWHFQEINSLVNSLRYPAQCSLIPNRYFSFYYAPWMLIAAIYLAFPIHGFTIKAAFAIGCGVYQILICLTLLHIAISRAKTRRHLYWAIYLVVFWAGIESLSALFYYLLRSREAMLLPSTPIHLPIFAGGMFWAIHHVSAAIALLLCWHIWETAESSSWRTTACCSLLIGYGFYSSVFVFLGAIPLGILFLVLEWRRRWKQIVTVACVSAAIIWPVLWLYLGKTNDVRFLFPYMSGTRALFPFATGPENNLIGVSGLLNRMDGIWTGLIVFLLFLVVNFLPYLIALVIYGKRLSWSGRGYAILSVAFLVSTYFVGFPEGDNYASRGYLISILVLGWLCAGLLPAIRISPWIVAGLCLGALGFAHESFQMYKSAVHIAQTPQAGIYSEEILALNRNRSARVISPGAWDSPPENIYDVEKFVAGGKVDLVTADRQLECLGPRGPWKWQQVPEISVK